MLKPRTGFTQVGDPHSGLPNEQMRKEIINDSFYDMITNNWGRSLSNQSVEVKPAIICVGSIHPVLWEKHIPRFKWGMYTDLYTLGIDPAFGNWQPKLEDIFSIEDYSRLVHEVGPAGITEINKRRNREIERMWCLDYYYRSWKPGITHCPVCGGFISDQTNMPTERNDLPLDTLESTQARVIGAYSADVPLFEFETSLIANGLFKHDQLANRERHFNQMLPKGLRTRC